MKFFASDNNSGVHHAIFEALQKANSGGAVSYGDDEYTAEAEALFKEHFGANARPFFVFSGTAANVLGLRSVLQPCEAVICPENAHINTSETGAPEAAGLKLYTVPCPTGKLDPEGCQRYLRHIGNEHSAQPKVVSITQSTEYATVYSVAELQALSAFCKEHGLLLHMDGARLANAAAALKTGFKEITTDVGVDLLSFGGTKNGMMFGEAVVFLNPALNQPFRMLRKQGLQLASKMRYLSAQFTPYLKEGIWRSNAENANNMAKLLATELAKVSGVKITRPVEVNAVFARMPLPAMEELWAHYDFHIWDATPEPVTAGEMPCGPEARLMTSFNTTSAEVLEFAQAVQKVLGKQ